MGERAGASAPAWAEWAENRIAAAEPHARALGIDSAQDDVRRLVTDSGSERLRRAAGAVGPPTSVVR
ncbi:MAG: hypothetical protein ABI355_01295 [Solirubrobacteraceae bacterium]